MRIKQLEYLIALKQYGSFLRTSQEIFVAQPAISAAIRELENELGYTLLTRNYKGVIFTEKGEQVLKKSKEIIDILEDIRALKYDTLNDVEGVLTIGCSSRFCNSIVIEAYTILHHRYPHLFIDIKKTNVIEVIENLDSCYFKLGLIQIDAVEGESIKKELEERNLTSVELFQDEIVFVVGSNHPLKRKKRVSLQEILQYPYITAKDVIHPTVENLFKKYGYCGSVIHIDDVAGMRHFIEKSNAVTYMTKSAMRNDNEVYNNNFTAVSITDFDWWCSVAWVHNQEPLSVIEQVVIDELISWGKQYN